MNRNRGSLFLFAFFFAASSMAQNNNSTLTDRQKELQVLNRLSFGPRAEDLDHIHKIGISAFIEEQLHPEKMDDSACDKELKKYPLVFKTSEELMALYPDPNNPTRRPELRGKVKDKKSADEAYRDIDRMRVEVGAAKITRAVYSRRQLQEVMADFWFNHFNVHFWKNEVPWLIIPYDRDVIRAHALGKFKDLLLAVAQSPAMLVYLDNASNHADPTGKASTSGKPGMRINENYGRELLELHTVGVNGGYTQQDVINAARVLTGWGLTGMNYNSAPVPVGFMFKPYQHDNGVKVVLGHNFGPILSRGPQAEGQALGVPGQGAKPVEPPTGPGQGGVEEGVQLIDFLSVHPSTAHFIATKLCRRFVCDDPPEDLVKRVADRFQATDGDIRQTLKAIFESPEFMEPRFYQVKIKTPFEFAASSLRVAGTTIVRCDEILWRLEGMGEPLYLCEPPTGYPDVAKAWLGSGSLLSRLNFAGAVFSHPYGGEFRTNIDNLAGNAPYDDGKMALDNLIHNLLLDNISEASRQSLEKQIQDPSISSVPLAGKKKGVDLKKVAALVLSVPEFQKR
ncbi:MAG TPA: DUF1800 domain-containing protein [bacterium]|nr:DUF1800 domain-containing protein [bacterium]